MLISSLSTTLLQIFCKIILNYYDIVLNSIDPYDISGGTSNMNRLRYYLSITLFEELYVPSCQAMGALQMLMG